MTGNAVLRLGLGILKKTIEGSEDDFAEAMLPLAEITDDEEKVELAKEILNYVAKVMAVHNKRLNDEKIKRALKPVFQERTENMVKTIFEEKYYAGVVEAERTKKPQWIAEGEAKGRVEGQVLSVLSVLTARFHSVPPKVQK